MKAHQRSVYQNAQKYALRSQAQHPARHLKISTHDRTFISGHGALRGGGFKLFSVRWMTYPYAPNSDALSNTDIRYVANDYNRFSPSTLMRKQHTRYHCFDRQHARPRPIAFAPLADYSAGFQLPSFHQSSYKIAPGSFISSSMVYGALIFVSEAICHFSRPLIHPLVYKKKLNSSC